MFKSRCAALVAAFVVAATAVLPFPALCQDATSGAQPTARAGGRPKIVLCLGGGGTRGAAHVGVLKVLEKEGIPIDYVIGTSIGAIVGGLYCAGLTTAELEERFRDVAIMKHFMTVPLWVRLAASPILIIPRLLGSRPYDGLYWGKKFRNYINATVPAGKTEIETFKIPFSAVSLNILDSKPYRISKGNLGAALQASSAVPQLRKPVEIGDKLFVDGGVVQNVPVALAKELGGDFIIAVNVDERLETLPTDHFRSIGSIAKYMLKFDLAMTDEPLLKQADVVIHPNVDGIGLVSTNKKDAIRALASGEEAAKAAVADIKAKLTQIGVAGLQQTH